MSAASRDFTQWPSEVLQSHRPTDSVRYRSFWGTSVWPIKAEMVWNWIQTFGSCYSHYLVTICGGTKWGHLPPSRRLCPPPPLAPPVRRKMAKISHFRQIFGFPPPHAPSLKNFWCCLLFVYMIFTWHWRNAFFKYFSTWYRNYMVDVISLVLFLSV